MKASKYGAWRLLLPVVLFALGIVLYFWVVPTIYGHVLTFIDWLFAGPDVIVSTLRESGIVFGAFNEVLATKIIMYVWLAAFAVSLFLAGSYLQNPPRKVNPRAVACGNEPLLLVARVKENIVSARACCDNVQVNRLVEKASILEEKLAAETPFGYGDDAAIERENEIAACLERLIATTQELNSESLSSASASLARELDNINGLLAERRIINRK